MEGQLTNQGTKKKRMTSQDMLNVVLETINSRFDKLEDAIFGNGSPGLLVTTAQHQKDLEESKKDREAIKKAAKEKDPYAWKNILILVVLMLLIHMVMEYLIPPEQYWEIILKIIL